MEDYQDLLGSSLHKRNDSSLTNIDRPSPIISESGMSPAPRYNLLADSQEAFCVVPIRDFAFMSKTRQPSKKHISKLGKNSD